MAAKNEVAKNAVETEVEKTLNEEEKVDIAKLREELKAELKAEIAAEMESYKGEVSEPATSKVQIGESKEELEYLNEKVEVLIPRGPTDPATYTVTHNGTSYQIKRGVKVMIPRKVKNIIDRSMAQQAAAMAFEDENAFDPSVYESK